VPILARLLLHISSTPAYTSRMDIIASWLTQVWFGLALSLILGWGMGGLGNWAADQLPHYPARTLTFDRHAWLHAWTLPRLWQRCPTCTQRVGMRSGLLEIGMALAFAISWWRFATQPALLILVWLYVAYLLVVLVIDLEHRRVLNLMLLPAGVVALVGSLVPGAPGPIAALLGGIAGFGAFVVIFLVGRGSMGAGDVKLAGVIGLMTGMPAVWAALAVGIVLGGVAAIVLIVSRRGGRSTFMAYGPYLALGAILILWFFWLR
jgi:prepilin signal peptidase PulO-like enzyme (type II secretory pathway)